MPDDSTTALARANVAAPAHGAAGTTVLIADAQQLFRQGLAALLREQPGWRVAGQAADRAAAVRLAVELRPRLALVDAALPPGDTADTLRDLRAASPATSIVVLSAHAEQEWHGHGLAAASVSKAASIDRLLEVMRAPPRDASTMRAPPPVALSAREREVLRRLAQGSRMREIAAALAISPKTVETYRSRLTTKLGIDDLAGLVRYAIRTGLVSAES